MTHIEIVICLMISLGNFVANSKQNNKKSTRLNKNTDSIVIWIENESKSRDIPGVNFALETEPENVDMRVQGKQKEISPNWF